MAPGLRDRELIGSRWTAAAAGAALLLPALAAQDGGKPAAPAPRAALDAVLERYHGPLRGAFDNALLLLREDDGAEPTQVLLALPDRMRVGRPDGTVDLLVGGAGWRCRRGAVAARLEGDELRELGRLRDHVRALMLVPLYDARRVARVRPGAYELVLEDGEKWEALIDEGANDIVELRGPAGAVRFESFLDTGVTRHPAVVEMAGLGRRRVAFLTGGTYLDPGLFEDPFLPARPSAGRPQLTKALADPTELPAEPELQDLPARTYLVLGAPGSWEQRCARMAAAAEELGEQGQMAHGLPTYRLDPTGTTLMIPFRPDPSTGSQPFVRQTGQSTLRVAAHRAVVVAPPPGSWEEGVARGQALLQAFLERRRLEPDGPPVCIPFLVPDRVPRAAELARLQLRLEQRVVER